MPPYDPLFSPPKPWPGYVSIDSLRLRMKRWHRGIRISIYGIVLPWLVLFAVNYWEFSRSFASVTKDGKVDPQQMARHISFSLYANAIALPIVAISAIGLVVCICYFIRDSLRLSDAVAKYGERERSH